MVFFAIVFIIYYTVWLGNARTAAEEQRSKEALELVLTLSHSAEFAWTEKGCDQCIDFDKVLLLKERKSYSGFWNLGQLSVERLYPLGKGECTRTNYPDCSTITIINNTNDKGISKGAFVNLCHYEVKGEPYVKCEIGRIYASAKPIKTS